jgi:superfamily II DNA or RNA helicase
MKLFDYQEQIIQMTRERIIAGDKNIILWLMTGAGKSLVTKEIIDSLIKNKQTILFIVKRRDLVLQAINKYLSHHDPSVIMGGEKGFDSFSPLQIASIDTLHRRIDLPEYQFLKQTNFLCVDEGHDTTAPKYREVFEKINYKALFAFTATPFKIGNKVHDIFDSCVKSIEAHELRDRGVLTPARIYAPKKIDVSGVKKVAGEFNQGQLFEKVSENKIIGDIVETWKKYGQNKPTILFAVNIKHSSMMARAFNQQGIPALHCDQSHTKDERQAMIKSLEKGTHKILCNVQTMTTGVDIPCAEIAIMARPTMSEALYIQMVGRVLRAFKICARCDFKYGPQKECPDCGSDEAKYKKEHAIILDHADNTSRHGFPYDVREPALTKKDKKENAKEIKIKTCKFCFAVLESFTKICPYCENEIEKAKQQREIKQESGELKEIDQTPQIKQAFQKLKWREKKFHTSPKQKFYLIHKKFGDIVFDVIEFPEHIRGEIQREGFLSSASKLVEKYQSNRAKAVYKRKAF